MILHRTPGGWLLAALAATTFAFVSACGDDSSHHDGLGGAGSGAEASTTNNAAVGSGGGGVAPQPAYAANVSIDHVEVNQGVGVPLVAAGALVDAAARPAPLIAGRPGVWRVFWKLAPGFMPRPIEAQLELLYADGDSQTRTLTKDLSSQPAWDTLAGSFAFILDDQAIRPGMSWRISLHEVGTATNIPPPNTPTAIPATGSIDLNIGDQAMNLNVVIVPATPSCTPGGPWQLSPDDERDVRNQIYNMYPVATLNLQFHAPVVLQVTDCNDSGAILDALSALRNSENLGPSYYYHAIFPHADDDVLPSGGYAWIIDEPTMGSDLVSYSVNFWPQEPNNVSHELGHNHGRLHSFNDPDYLPSGVGMAACGRRSSWGFGIGQWQHPYDERRDYPPLHNVEGWLVAPTDQLDFDAQNNTCAHHPNADDGPALNDIMGYAHPYWISAYTYAGLAKRIALVSQWDQQDWRAAPAWQRWSLHGTFLADGSTHWRLQRGAAATPTQLRRDRYHHAWLSWPAPAATQLAAPQRSAKKRIRDDELPDEALPIGYKRGPDGAIDGVVVVLPQHFEVPAARPFSVMVAGMLRRGDWAHVRRP